MAKKKVTTGQFIGAVTLLLVLISWVGYAALFSIPSEIHTITQHATPAECQGSLEDVIRVANDPNCTTAGSVGSKSGAAFGLVTDLVGVGLLIGFGPKLYKTMKLYKQR